MSPNALFTISSARHDYFRAKNGRTQAGTTLGSRMFSGVVEGGKENGFKGFLIPDRQTPTLRAVKYTFSILGYKSTAFG